MLQANPKIDPVAEILRLAYRRGLAIHQEQSQERPVNTQEVDDKIKDPDSKEVTDEKQSK
jgi:hypothetical protein